eukprot:4500633-Pleurochrysis_carterae.AAC.1
MMTADTLTANSLQLAMDFRISRDTYRLERSVAAISFIKQSHPLRQLPVSTRYTLTAMTPVYETVSCLTTDAAGRSFADCS